MRRLEEQRISALSNIGIQNKLILCPRQQHFLYKFSDRVYSRHCIQWLKEPIPILEKYKEKRLTEVALKIWYKI